MPSAPNRNQKQKHIHKVKRLNLSTGNKIYFCVLPDCPWKIKVALSLGKQVICWRCGEPFYLNEYSIRLAKPHCEGCHQSKNSALEYDSSIHNPEAIRPTLHPLEVTDERINPPSLSERLKQASQINHTVLKDEEEEL